MANTAHATKAAWRPPTNVCCSACNCPALRLTRPGRERCLGRATKAREDRALRTVDRCGRGNVGVRLARCHLARERTRDHEGDMGRARWRRLRIGSREGRDCSCVTRPPCVSPPRRTADPVLSGAMRSILFICSVDHRWFSFWGLPAVIHARRSLLRERVTWDTPAALGPAPVGWRELALRIPRMEKAQSTARTMEQASTAGTSPM